ncbi:BLUF domain-containing protein [Mucilaginibacter achroorhodeus]|uniref:BLUF domain-containing protein n=1 Tax=Mucilaginibacter achroorhodeus TaxID=2599294 RepID=A0A563U4E9_9SPHI|nr:BLUF domain-containing protein [Mucilaginibacter achroorhodeus]TWR26219.1 BLUF domain-containing protein [Mucilaginibacter achroorhodeus]
MLHYLIYMSHATHPMSDNNLDEILATAVKNNIEKDITGMLVFIDEQSAFSDHGRFIQVLEGSEETVKDIYKTISKDDRHNQITELFSYPIKQRNFPDWSMGFKRVSDASSVPDELNKWFDPDHFPKAMNKEGMNIPLTYLRSFYDIHK